LNTAPSIWQFDERSKVFRSARAVCITREYLWEYMQQECLLEEPVEFWGGAMSLRSLNQFFDRALYSTVVGYQESGRGELADAPAV